jgi:hypothetical protein
LSKPKLIKSCRAEEEEDQIEKNEMVVGCNAYREQEKSIQGFVGKTRGKESNWST